MARGAERPYGRERAVTSSGGARDEPVPIDPDVDLHVPAQRAETAGAHVLLVLAAVAAGGIIGALARYAAVRAWPGDPASAPLVTLGINVLGSFLIGVLMVPVAEGHGRRTPHPLLRPFAGTGVLGGFTTFSAYALDARDLLERGEGAAAFGYVAGTLLGSLGAVWAAVTLTRRVFGRPGAGR
ncbi:fluoride efflux transporter FluC [Streptomyces tsukubensis]|uniref:fluoride efflux transporter FluC n=1 Tax=Streptomyces tsukubensis TaxID=83656 RepID=UPI003675156F